MNFKVLMKGEQFAFIEINENQFNIGYTDVPDLYPADLTTEELKNDFLELLSDFDIPTSDWILINEALVDIELRPVTLELITN